MVRQAITRLVAAAGVLSAGCLAAVVAVAIGSGGPADAAPKAPATPTSVQVVGAGVTGKVVVQKATQPRAFADMYSEVSWLASAKPQTTALAAAKLGPKYTVTVFVKNTPTQVYDLYPMAAGGPRVHRGAKQPSGRKVTDGWFFGMLTMPGSLKDSGVPINAKPDVIAGGIGGGTGTDIDTSSNFDAAGGVLTFLDQMRRLFLLNGAILVVILFGLAGIAFLIRRRV
jgi:hypothetical protein